MRRRGQTAAVMKCEYLEVPAYTRSILPNLPAMTEGQIVLTGIYGRYATKPLHIFLLDHLPDEHPQWPTEITRRLEGQKRYFSS